MVDEFAPKTFPRNIITVDSSSPLITYAGTWEDIPSPRAWGQKYKRSSKLGDTASFTFTGTAILGRFLFSPQSSSTHWFRIDGGDWQPLNLLDETEYFDWCVLAYNLPRAQHTIELKVGEDGKHLNIDCFRYEVEEGALQVDAMIEAMITARITELSKAFGRTDWLKVVEQAPATGVYFQNPSDLTDGDYTSILMDIKRRAITRPLGDQLAYFKQATTGELQPDIIKWGGTSLTGRDISQDLSKLSSWDESGRAKVNVATAGGNNIIIDKLTQTAYRTYTASMGYHSETRDGVTADSNWRGMFFRPLMQGCIQGFLINMKNTSGANATCYISLYPYPHGPRLYRYSFTCPAGTDGVIWAGAEAIGRPFWPYDSLFVVIDQGLSATVGLGYKSVSPYEGFMSGDGGVTWYDTPHRYLITVQLAAANPVVLPVSGIVTNVPMPGTTSSYATGGVTLNPGEKKTIASVYGAGRLIHCHFTATRDDVALIFKIDGVELHDFAVGGNTPANLARGFTASTPGISLLRRTLDGQSDMLITLPLEFRQSIEFIAENLESVSVTAEINAYLSLLR